MIISRGRNYIFVHMPKTGGTAMALALEARAKKDDILIGDTPKAKKRKPRLDELSPKGRLWKHATLADIGGIVSADDMAQMFIFTLVRNPWDRMVSYYHWLRVQKFDHPAVRLSKACAFEPFVRNPATVHSLRAHPAAHYVTDAAGNERCNAFIRLEHLDDDLAPLEAHLGFEIALTRANASMRRPDYRSYYDAGLRAFLGEMCAEDIERFGYRF